MATPPPGSVAAGSPFGLTVAVDDKYGNAVATSSGDVDLSLSGGTGGGTLAGTVEEPLSNGLATFTALSISPPAVGYTLQASSTGLGPATSALDVTHGAATQLVVTSAVPANVTAGNPFGLAIAAVATIVVIAVIIPRRMPVATSPDHVPEEAPARPQSP